MTAIAAESLEMESDGDEAVAALRRFISRGEYGLREVPQLLREILEHEYWRHRGAGFGTFREFVEADPPPGLGADLGMVRRLIAHDTATLDELDQATVGSWGGDRGNQYTGGKVSNVHLGTPRRGNDRQAVLRRLRKDRPDLHARVVADELTPHGAMVEAGYRRRAYRLPLTVDGVVRAIRRHFTPEQIAEIVQRLG